jgi:hypothetical protein
MEQRETLDAELAELANWREGSPACRAEVAKARNAALVEIDWELDGTGGQEERRPGGGSGCAPSTNRAAARLAPPAGLLAIDLPGRAGANGKLQPE